MSKIIYIIWGAILLASCSKPEPLVPISGNASPIFYIKGMKNVTDSFNYAAGVNGMYMFSNWEQSKYNNKDSAYQFQAIMAPAGCITCNPRFSIVFIDSGKTTLGQPSYIDNYIKPGIFPFINNSVLKGGVYIGWTNEAGITYSTKKGNTQPVGATVEVIKITSYSTATNTKLRKIQLKFNCRCYNTQADYVDFKNMEASVIIGYP